MYAYVQTVNGRWSESLEELDGLVRYFEDDERIVFQTLTLIWQARLAMLFGRTTIASEAAHAAERLIRGLPLQAEHAALYLALCEIATHEGRVGEAFRFAELTRRSARRAWYSADVRRAQFIAEVTMARAAFLAGDAKTAYDIASLIAGDAAYDAVSRACAAAEAAFHAALAGRDAREATASACAFLADATPSDAHDAVALATAHTLLQFLDTANEWRMEIPQPSAIAPFTNLIETRHAALTVRHLALAARNGQRAQRSDHAVESALALLAPDGERFETRLLRAYFLREASTRSPVGAEKQFDLTARENEILTLLVDGLSNKEIAQRLILSPRTVETHVERVLGKLDVGTRSRAIAKALRLGMVSLQE